MDMTGWVTGQVFLQTVDDQEVATLNAYLTARGLSFQVLTLSERMVLDPADPGGGVSSDRYSVAVHVAGFPQVVGPVLSDLLARAHGGSWTPDPPEEPGAAG